MKFWCQQFRHSETYHTLDPHDRQGLKPSDIRQVGSARALGCWQNHTQQYGGLGLWPCMVEKRFQISGPKMIKSYMITQGWKCWIYTSAMLLKWAGVIDQVSGQPWDYVKKGLTSTVCILLVHWRNALAKQHCFHLFPLQRTGPKKSLRGLGCSGNAPWWAASNFLKGNLKKKQSVEPCFVFPGTLNPNIWTMQARTAWLSSLAPA